MNEPPVSDQARNAEQAHAADGSVRKHGTWPHGAPALRIGKVHQDDEAAPPAAPRPPTTASFRAPWYLRLLRLAVGLTLLVLAWCGVLIIDLLANSALQPVRQSHLALDTAIAVLKLVGACWIGIATLASIIAGAFSLSLALTNRDWR
jgi:hypothetical protein